jgi:U3 small nucleolar RNA-associated protein 3
VQKDISSLTTEEKLEILTAEAPELLGLVQDFRAKITLMRERVFPLIQRYRTRHDTRAPRGPTLQRTLC